MVLVGHPRRRGAHPGQRPLRRRGVRGGQRPPQPDPAAGGGRQPAGRVAAARSRVARRRSIATSPPARSASRCRAWCSAPTRRRPFAVWLTPLLRAARRAAAGRGAVDVGRRRAARADRRRRSIFGELVPKSLALQYPTQTALYTLIPMVAVALDLPAVHQVAERDRPAAAAAARRAAAGPPPHPLARGDRAADRREPRRRPARARRAPAAAARAAAEPAAGEAADGAAHARSRRSTSTRRSNEVIGIVAPEPVLAAAGLPRLDRQHRRHPAHQGPRALARQRRHGCDARER